MQINPIFNNINKLSSINYSNNFSYNNNERFNSQKSQKIGNSKQSIGMNTAEILGRAQINFGGINPEIHLTNADNNFIKGIAKVFRLNKDEEQKTEQILKDFLSEFNFKELADMRSDDPIAYSNESAYLIENITKDLDLTDYENTVLTDLETEHIDYGDITNINNYFGENLIHKYKYTRDFTPLKHLLTHKYNTDTDSVYNIFEYLKNCAFAKNCESIYDLFNKENRNTNSQIINNLRGKKYGDLNSDQKTDLLLDLIKLSSKTTGERLEGINRREDLEICEDFEGSISLANIIAKNFDIEINDELLNILDKRKTNTERSKNGKSAIEVAFTIAEEYKLPGNAARKIANMIEEYEKKDRKEKFDDLLNALNENS